REFKRALDRFPEDLPFLYEEERSKPGVVDYLYERMEDYRGYADPASYRRCEHNGGIQIWYQPPEAVLAASQPYLQEFQARVRWVTLHNWARQTLEAGVPSSEMTVPDAFALARELRQPDDFATRRLMETDPEHLRVEAVVAAATAILVVDFS